MAKKQNRAEEEAQRRSRKEVLLARKQARQTRQIRLAAGGVATLLVLVFLVAIVNEFFIVPGQAVAVVNGSEISVGEWQDRVRYERAQRIILLENQLEAFGGDVGIIQQFGGQVILELQDAEGLALNVRDQMAQEVMIRQEAVARGITVTDEDVDREIQESFNFFGGESPTPQPTPTETIMPTPSITPIPTEVITEVVATSTPMPTATGGPTATPQPTATPVSEETFQEQYNDLLAQFRDLGVSEETYREVVRVQIYRERLADVLAEEQDLSTDAEQASIFLLSFGAEEEANAAREQIEEDGFLTVWNEIRSTPFDPDSESTASATEVLWRTQEDLATSLGAEVAETAFLLPPGTPSPVIEEQVDEETTRYFILQVSGREVRPLSEQAIQTDKFELLSTYIDEQLVGSLELTEAWRGRVPNQPVLDPKFLVQPTQAPVQPTPDLGVATPATGEEQVPVVPTPSDGS